MPQVHFQQRKTYLCTEQRWRSQNYKMKLLPTPVVWPLHYDADIGMASTLLNAKTKKEKDKITQKVRNLCFGRSFSWTLRKMLLQNAAESSLEIYKTPWDKDQETQTKFSIDSVASGRFSYMIFQPQRSMLIAFLQAWIAFNITFKTLKSYYSLENKHFVKLQLCLCN